MRIKRIKAEGFLLKLLNLPIVCNFPPKNSYYSIIYLTRTYTWASCPDGYFLQGFYRSRGTDLQNVEHVRCCRPTTFKNISANCKDLSVRISLDNQGWSSCSNGSFIVGIYKESCNTLSCIEEFKCCQMSPSAKEKLMTPKKKGIYHHHHHHRRHCQIELL